MNKLENRTERFHYKGSLEEYQLKMQNKGKYQSITYSSYQNYLYKRALYGIGALNEEERAHICKKKKHRISQVYYKGQIAINLYKQKLTKYSRKKALMLCLFLRYSSGKCWTFWVVAVWYPR